MARNKCVTRVRRGLFAYGAVLLAAWGAGCARTATTPAAQPLPPVVSPPPAADAGTDPFTTFTRHWRDREIWMGEDKYESAEYEPLGVKKSHAGERMIGELGRAKVFILIGRELADPVTRTRSLTGQGRDAFKVVTYHMAADGGELLAGSSNPLLGFAGPPPLGTMAYVGASDLKSLLLEVAVVDTRGVTFKQIVNHKGTLSWHQFSRRAGEGHTSFEGPAPSGGTGGTGGLVFREALPLVLRGYPFESPVAMTIGLMPEQGRARETSMRPDAYRVEFVGTEEVVTGAGKTWAYHLRLRHIGPTRELRQELHYWFDADPATGHIMVQYIGEDMALRLRNVVSASAPQP